MRGVLARCRRFGAHTFESLAPLPIVLVLHRLGVAGHAPALVVLVVLLIAVALQHREVQCRLAGGDLRQRLHARMLLQISVSCTLSIYVLGWGPLLVIGYAVAALLHIRWSGSRAWIPAVAWSLAGIAAGQLGIATGLVFSYLTPVQSQLAGFAGAVLVVLLTRQYGLQMAERERAEDAVQRSEQRFRALVQHSSDMTVVLGVDGFITDVTPAVRTMLGYSPEELVGTNIFELLVRVEESDEQRLREGLPATSEGCTRSEVCLRHADGSVRWHDVTLRNLTDTPAVGALVANHRDITEERYAKQRLAYEASHDLLTGVQNRASFIRRLDRHLAAGGGRGTAVLFIDLDGFKQVNDTLGHEAGDTVLVEVAERLRVSTLGSDLVGRLGGDEFAVALPGIGSVDNALGVAHRILAGLGEPVQVAGHSVPVEGSVGIALAPAAPAHLSATELLRQADLAMYEAKRTRGRRCAVYRPELEPATRISAEEVRAALANDELYLVYQPVVGIPDGYVIGAEALVRWNSPTRGSVPPSELVPVAEENGLIGALGEWVLRAACHQLARWREGDEAAHRLTLNVNMAADQLEEQRTAHLVMSVLGETGVPAQALVIEVTESALADSPEARATLEALHDAGVRIAIDDFGTGYSSLQYLTRLPVDVLKLDRAFVSQLDGTPEGSAIAEAVIRLAHTLHLNTTAEGVENRAQVAELCALGYSTAQGYLFARPLPPEELATMLTGPVGGAGGSPGGDVARLPSPRGVSSPPGSSPEVSPEVSPEAGCEPVPPVA